jgi:cytochrome P450
METMQAIQSDKGVAVTDENPYLPENVLDPYPLYARMRKLTPVVWLESVGVWGVFVDDVCREILLDAQRFGSAGGGGLANYYREKPWREPSVVFEVDPPDHTRTRRVLSRLLSPKTVKALTDRTAELARQCVASAYAKGRFDFVTDLAKPLVMQIVPDALGLPKEGRENVLIYNKYLIKGRTYGREQPWTSAEIEESTRVVEWVQQICDRASISSDGLGAKIYAAADAGEISLHEANMLIRSFLSAGADNTFGSISNTIYFLLSNPEQWKRLREQPTLARNAYDESLRYHSPAQTIARNTRMALTFHGANMGEHDKIMMFTGSANRDPKRWEDPDAFKIDRNVTGHLGLGTGIHGCVGQMIARMEGEQVLAEVARNARSLAFDTAPVEWLKSGRAVSKLPVVVVD